MVAKGSSDRRSLSSTNATSTSKKRRVSSATHEKKKIAKPIGICGFCLGDNDKNAKGVPEKMINCAECGNSGHPSCLQYSEKLVKKIRTIHWQCIDCKRCIVCNISDDSLLFCDYCDSGIHPKCCNPPLNVIPKGDFACYLCSDEIKSSPKKSLIKTLSSSSSTRSHRSTNSNSDETTRTTDISPSIPQVIDGTSNFFLSNKQKSTNNRKQSVQKAMKYLREKKTLKSSKKNLLKRLQSSKMNSKSNELLAESLLISSKTSRIKKNLIHDDLSLNPQTSTPLLKRQLSNKKLLTIEPITPPLNSRVSRRSDIQLNDELNKSTSTRLVTKRKHSTNSTSPISTTSSIIIKKRVRNESPGKKIQLKNKRKESQTEEDQSDDDKHTKSTGSKRKLNLDLSKYKNPPAFLKDALPDDITENDVYLFLESRQNSTKLITECSEKFHHSNEYIDDDSTNTRWPPYIVFGSDLIKTWYSSSYPQEYARVPRLYICEFCLKYMKCEQVYDRHRKKCTTFHPPANEIYHKDDLSVFEVDGNINRIYCQNLCLLAKLFLDHKTLYYDVEPFLFYVLTRNDSNGCHFLGYFSKEKHCPQKYNLSCITVLPNCQRRGYGRFLIELSYLLSQKEGQIGTPERPLSTLGAQTYEAYWKIKLVEQLLIYYNENNEKCLLKTIMNETRMTADDIIETLQNLGVLTMKSTGKPVIIADIIQLEKIIKNEKIKHAHWVSIDSEYLRFTPVLTTLLLTNEEKAVEKEVKEIQIVFKEIGREAAEAASLAAESADGTNSTENVRYIRRRKFGQKRRSIIVKRRTPIHNKSNKNDSILTNDDSCTTDLITNDDDEHSQEYVSRRRISTINESIKEKEKAEEEENETIPISSSPKVSLNQPILKQLKLDQFLKIVNSTNEEKTPLNIDIKNEEINHDNDDIHTQTRRITRNTRLHSTSKSESEPIKIENNISIETKSDHSLTQEIPSSIDQQISLKKRPITSSNIQLLIDNTLSSSMNKINQLNHEISVTSTNPSETPSSTLSEILANPLLTTINNIEDQTKIASIESQLKTTAMELINYQEKNEIKSIESIDDNETPPSLISPTTMIISQSNHYNYSTRSKQQQQQETINNSTNINYNFDNTSYPYPSTSSYNMESYYYPSTTPMNYMPYYPTSSSSSVYPPSGTIYSDTSDQQSYYSISYNGNGTTPYVYPTAQSSSTASTTQRH